MISTIINIILAYVYALCFVGMLIIYSPKIAVRCMSSFVYYLKYPFNKNNIVTINITNIPSDIMELTVNMNMNVLVGMWSMKYFVKNHYISNMEWKIFNDESENDPEIMINLMFNNKCDAIRFKMEFI